MGANRRRKLVLTPVAVEKLTHRKIAEKTLQEEALQTTISVLADIFYLPNSSYFDKTGVFQQPRLLTTVITTVGRQARC